MNACGHPSEKGSEVISCTAKARQLKKPIPPDYAMLPDSRIAASTNYDEDGRHRVTGKPAKLEVTQEYPQEYASKAFEIWQAWRT